MLVFNCCRVQRLLARRSSSQIQRDPKKTDEVTIEKEEDLVVERIRIENLELRFCITKFMLQLTSVV